MIQLLSEKYARHIACLLAVIFFRSLAPAYGHTNKRTVRYAFNSFPYKGIHTPGAGIPAATAVKKEAISNTASIKKSPLLRTPLKKNIGGPGQPEMSSFKSIGADDMVNLFTGDFSYNIPLLDVGGYPVNLFYDGGTSMEQEASWVGLNWNINPGNINRNMRGIPDDFNGEEMLVQSQNMKPNKTWGINLGGDLEGIGLKDMFSFGVSLGVSFNNYLGPAIDFGVKGGVNFKLADKVTSEKGTKDSLALKLGVNAGLDLNSRTGLTISPSVSLTASSFMKERSASFGIGASTGYNSRSGIKELHLGEQMSFSKYREKAEKNKQNSSSVGANVFSTSISFAKPSYLPAIRMPLSNEAYSGHFQLGGGIFGGYGSVEAEVFQQTSSVSASKITQKKPMVGYMYAEKAVDNPNAVMDFTRFNDREVTPHTPLISAPQYTYDVFSIQGEGTGGSIRAYRNQPGFVRDNYTASQDKSLGIGADIGIPGHYGANVNMVKTPTTIGEWGGPGKPWHEQMKFRNDYSNLQEYVYFRNPGENSVMAAGQYTRLGGTDLVRFKLSGDKYDPVITTSLERFSTSGALLGTANIAAASAYERPKRTQVISFLTASDAVNVGLDKVIKSYDNQNILNADTLVYESIDRTSEYRKKHHISQITVTESNGKRYIYGIPVYNITQKDLTFTVSTSDLTTPDNADTVRYNNNETETGNTNPNLGGGTGGREGYIQVTETPAYAHSFLLSGLLSPDYVDVTGNGITEDDLGNAVKFNYTRIKQNGQWAVHKWRTPVDDHKASFNAGNRSELKDDKGLVSYGERESWYLQSIESKTMIAIFRLEDRDDGKSVNGEYGGINTGDNSLKRLRSIDLYNKSDLKKNGLTNAKPVKSVYFKYSYKLCNLNPDNALGEGKLTLDSIYFTYNGQNRANKNKYVFSYVKSDGSGNPSFAYSANDRWGTYKPESMNPGSLRNHDYPYTPQLAGQKDAVDENAAAWSLKKILLPSGGQIEVEYESDDYAFVQNRRAAEMMSVAGFGNSATMISDRLYNFFLPNMSGGVENDYVFINVPEPCATPKEVYKKYLDGMEQLCLRVAVMMPKGTEFVTVYGVIAGYGVYDASRIWVRLQTVNGFSPVSLTALEYLREQLPGQAIPGHDVSEGGGLQQIGDALAGMWYSLKTAFTDPVKALRSDGKAQRVVLNQSFARLNDPDGYKYGGGQRVKTVKLKDNWNRMTGQFTSVYGKSYDYTTKEVFNGVERRISSGVASYEPAIGGEENPFQTILRVADKLPLGPTSYGAVELPALDAFFPAPVVGYSKVTVRSMSAVTPGANQKTRSGIGRQVTEYYTAKDFPVYYSHTSFDPATDMQAHEASTTSFFYKYAFDSRALSQGFLVATNDMHGKLKSIASYAENDTTVRVNYMENFYKNTGVNGLNEQFDFVSSQGGVVTTGNMGIDVELMTDVREFTVKSDNLEVQGQVDLFPVVFPIWLPFIWPVAGNSESYYRAITTTKVISYHSIVDSVVVIDKGSQVATKNILYDAETGDVIVNRTNNEFNQPVYTTKYPAWWAYSGMGLAYKNIDAILEASINEGKITAGFDVNSVLESGDELYILGGGSGGTSCLGPSGNVGVIWAFDKNKQSTSLNVPVKDLMFFDKNGQVYTGDINFQIIRSGKRNMLDLKLAEVTSMVNPVTTGSTRKLAIGSDSRVVNASAIEYSEKWLTDDDMIRRSTIMYDRNACAYIEVEDCNGQFEKSINPYRKGLIGNFRPLRNMVFYGNRGTQTERDPASQTNLPQNGFLENFKLYWDFNTGNNLAPDGSNANWVWQNQLIKVNAKGLELETKNALDIYTSAQYGFNKSLPVAIANNSHSDDMAYDGFEEYGYNAFLNKSAVNTCGARHIDLSGMTNAQIVDADAANFRAHTGKNVLAVNANSTATKQIKVIYNHMVPDYIQYAFGQSALTTLNNPGVFDVSVPFYGNSNGTTPTSPLNYSFDGSGGMFCRVDPVVQQICYGDPLRSEVHLHYMINASQYYEVATTGTYALNFVVQATQNPSSPAMFSVDIYDLNGVFIGSYNSPAIAQGGDAAVATINACLVKGKYKMIFSISEHYDNICVPSSTPPTVTCCSGVPNGNINLPARTFRFSIGSPGYASLATSNCTYTTPIAGNEYMLNQPMTFTWGQKMTFSAWVKESCNVETNGGVPCTAATYANNKVVFSFDCCGSPVECKPNGPIVDGWQRYEGDFTIPVYSGMVTMSFVNSSGSTVYFDDIRLHPYNANMKSYVYDPVNLRLISELDENNYATFYEYDEEGTLVRTKIETREGIKTVSETRSAKQKNIREIQ